MLGQLQEQQMGIARDNLFGEANYNRIHVGDLISWTDLSEEKVKQFGIVLSKYITTLKHRKVCMLKVVSTKDNRMKNILAVIVKIESKMTT